MDSKERLSDQPSQPLSEATADFQALVENLAEPVVIMDRAGTIRFMNPRAERMLVLGLRERSKRTWESRPTDYRTARSDSASTASARSSCESTFPASPGRASRRCRCR